jgi:hypothetical protein
MSPAAARKVRKKTVRVKGRITGVYRHHEEEFNARGQQCTAGFRNRTANREG